MKIQIKKSQLDSQYSLIEKYVNRALLKVPGYEINELEIEIPTEHMTITDLYDLEPIIAGYEDFPIWLEIPKSMDNNDIPASFSFSTYETEDENGDPVTIQRKVSDMTISAVGTTNNIRYLQSVTSKLTKSDLDAIVANANIIELSLSERDALVKNPQGEYYVEGELI
jgi:hypothetical protein